MLAVVGWQELLPVFIIIIILFGARKLPELGRSLGQGIKEFRKASRAWWTATTKRTSQAPRRRKARVDANDLP